MKYFYSIAILLITINSSFGQDSSKTKNCTLKHGIQFQINDFLNLSNFNDFTFSYRYLLNESSGLRISFLTRYYNDSSEGNLLDDTLSYYMPSNNYSHDLKLSIQYLTNVISHNDFSLLFGSGLSASYVKSDRIYERIRTDYFRSAKKYREGLGYGIDIIIGVEYKLYD